MAERTVLNAKMKRFVEAYDGNTVEAMRVAGYEGADNFLEHRGNELLAQPQIISAIKERSKIMASSIRAVATREERLAFWTSIQRNEDPHYKPIITKDGTTEPEANIPMGFRLKASEYLGKAEGDFIERIDIRQTVSITDVINEAYAISDNEIDAIEAEYEAARSIKLNSKHILAPNVPSIEDLI